MFFSDKATESLVSNGLGKSKREARKVALKQLVTLLVQNGQIKMGLKDKSFVKGQNSFEDKLTDFIKGTNQEKIDVPSEERNKRLKREIKRLGKRMLESLNEDNFIEACKYFCQIICNKQPEWNEVAQIWSYAIFKKDIKFISIILDLIQYKRVHKDMADEFELIKNKYTNSTEKEGLEAEEVQERLNTLYGFGRIRCQNPFDIVVEKYFKVRIGRTSN